MVMEKKQYGVDEWIVRATEKIKFTPDRLAVAAELREHLEDKLFDLRRIYPDMPQEAAVTRALGQMGDAEEVGLELAKIHTPWMGWLWRLSQTILGIVLVVTAIIAINHIGSGGNGWYRHSSRLQPGQFSVNAVYTPLDTADIEAAYLEGYRISVRQAALIEESDTEHGVGIILQTLSPFFWSREGRTVCERMAAVDDLGNRYYPYRVMLDGTTSDDINFDETGYIQGSPNGYGPFYKNYILIVHNLDPSAQWIRLEYDFLGRTFSIGINLREGKQ